MNPPHLLLRVPLGALALLALAFGPAAQDPQPNPATPTPATPGADGGGAEQPLAAFARGLVAYRAGRFPEAHAAFQLALQSLGDAAPAELRWNGALAALRVLRTSDAEEALQPLLQHADERWHADAEFGLALAAHQRAERAVLAAQLADAEPLAWTMALRAMQQAIDGFARADRLRGRWPAASRNAERATQRLAELERLRDARQPPEAKQTPEPEPPPPPPSPDGQSPEEQPPELPGQGLEAVEVAQLLQRLQKQEQQKRTLRQNQPRPAARPLERDW